MCGLLFKKTSKKLHFLVQLKRAKLSTNDLLLFYTTCIRSAIDYAVPVFHHSLPKYLINELERLPKRAMSIIFPHLSYNEALRNSGLLTLEQHHRDLCIRLFNNIINDTSHKLRNLLPAKHNCKYNLRKKRNFDLPSVHTDRFKKTFIPAMSVLLNY